MKRGYGIGLIASVVFAFVAGTAGAQVTTANGPYYATPSWDQTLPASTRFIVLSNMKSEAVLDRETGSVWEQSPSATSDNWYAQSSHCADLSKGGRKGWRLPTIQDLASLVDPTQFTPALPSGHPFNVAPIKSRVYWSATTEAPGPTSVRLVDFDDGSVFGEDKSVYSARAWCVRGGQGVDPQ